MATAAAAMLWLAADGFAVTGDPVRGERVFQRCFACHSVNPKEPLKLEGPSLYRVVGRRAASVPNFQYSPALLEQGRAGLVWTPQVLDRFVADPDKMLPGIRMGFFGLAEAEDRADLIAYLEKAGKARP